MTPSDPGGRHVTTEPPDAPVTQEGSRHGARTVLGSPRGAARSSRDHDGVMAGTARRLRNAVVGGYQAVVGRGVNFTAQPLGQHVDPEGLAGYYCGFKHKAIAARASGGMPHNGVTGEIEDWVVPVAQAALGFWELRLEGGSALPEFLHLVDWLESRAQPACGGVAWFNDFPQKKFGLAPPWLMGMGQGEAISVLLRAHAATGNAGYLDLAKAAFEPMRTPVTGGGAYRELDGWPVIEEYPTEQPCAVLNGWILALFGLHELGTSTGHHGAHELFESSAAGLVQLLPRYDIGWWSLYSLYPHRRPDLAKPFYHRLHCVLLRGLHLVHPDPILIDTARRWDEQATPLAVARASVNKVAFRMIRAGEQI
jgi:heparosan-N-sulfate-glucuronate 5-epimerase